MVKRSPGSLDAVFAALSDPTRREMVRRLSEGGASVSELAEPFDMSLVAAAKHVGVLEQAGLVSTVKEGRVRHCELEQRPLRDVVAWVARTGRFWEDQFDSLERYLAETAGPPKAER